MNSEVEMSKKILATIIVLLALGACERFSVNYAGVGEPDLTPEYTVPFDQNASPATSNN